MKIPGVFVAVALLASCLLVPRGVAADGNCPTCDQPAFPEAAAFLAGDTGKGWRLRALLAGPALTRRRALKHLSYHLPGRPALRFIYQYLLRGGFLDGRAGYRYCRLLARYEGFAAAEISRLRAVRQNPTTS